MSAQAYADESDDIALLAGRGPSSEELGSSAGVCCCPSPMRRFCLRVRSELCSVVGLFVLVHIICWLVGARRAAAIIAPAVVGVDISDEFQTTELRAALDAPPEGMSFGHVPVDNADDPFAAPPGEDSGGPWAWCIVGQIGRAHV